MSYSKPTWAPSSGFVRSRSMSTLSHGERLASRRCCDIVSTSTARVQDQRRKIVKRLAIATIALAFAGATVLAHPHFRKTITAKLGTVDATVAYQTVPANEMHAQNAKVGAFTTPRAPKLTLSGELKAGAITLPAGEYTIGVIKNGDKDWTMALYPGKLARGTEPDASKIVKLDSQFATDHGTSEHMMIDITPGHGKQEGKAVLLLHFGTLYLAGSLS